MTINYAFENSDVEFDDVVVNGSLVTSNTVESETQIVDNIQVEDDNQNLQFELDGDNPTPFFNLLGNEIRNLNVLKTKGDGSSSITFLDAANGDDKLLELSEGGGVEVLNGDLEIGNAASSDGSVNIGGTGLTVSGDGGNFTRMIGNDGDNPATGRPGGRLVAPENRDFYVQIDANSSGDHFGVLVKNGTDTIEEAFKVNANASVEIVNGQLKLQHGTESDPSYSFTTDTNTGFFRPNTGRIGVSHGGQEKWRFDSNDDFRSVGSNSNINLNGNVIGGLGGVNDANQGVLRLANNAWIRGRDSSNSTDIKFLKANTDDQLETGSPFLIRDQENNVDVAEFPEGETPRFYQGLEAGTIEAPEDSYSQLVDMGVTDGLSAGDQVGYTLALDSTKVFQLYAEADGSGGTQNAGIRPVNNLHNENGDVVTDGEAYLSVDSSGGLRTVTLSNSDAKHGKEINVKRNGTFDVTIDTEGGQTIDDSSSITLASDNEAVTLVYNSLNDDWGVW